MGSVAASTAATYASCLAAFRSWWLRSDPSAVFPDKEAYLPSRDMPALDRRLSAYLEDLFASRTAGAKEKAAGAICAVQLQWPECRGHLRRAWRLLKSWKYAAPCRYRAPWPPMLACAVSTVLFGAGHFDAGLFVLLGFHCLLRPSETCALQWSDFAESDLLGGFSSVLGILTLRNPKTARRGARVQHVTVCSKGLAAYWRHWRATSSDVTPFASYSVVRRIVTHALDSLLGGGHGYSLGGLRAGGASYMYLETDDVAAVMRRGRWASLQTLDHYLQVGAALMANSNWSDETRLRIRDLGSMLLPLLAVRRR